MCRDDAPISKGMRLIVPDLLRKLYLLVDHGGFDGLQGLAQELGVAHRTLRSWTNSHGKRSAGAVSRGGSAKLLALYCAEFPDLTAQQVIKLLTGPTADLETAFLSLQSAGLRVFLENVSASQPLEFFRARRGMTLIEVCPKQPDEPEHRITLGTAFWLQAPARHNLPHVIGVQLAPASCGLCRIKTHKNKLFYPARDTEHDRQTMEENTEPGLHYFATVQSARPFPALIYEAMQEGVPLDRTDRAFLLEHLKMLSRKDLAVHGLKLRIDRASPEAEI